MCLWSKLKRCVRLALTKRAPWQQDTMLPTWLSSSRSSRHVSYEAKVPSAIKVCMLSMLLLFRLCHIKRAELFQWWDFSWSGSRILLCTAQHQTWNVPLPHSLSGVDASVFNQPNKLNLGFSCCLQFCILCFIHLSSFFTVNIIVLLLSSTSVYTLSIFSFIYVMSCKKCGNLDPNSKIQFIAPLDICRVIQKFLSKENVVPKESAVWQQAKAVKILKT